MDDHLKEALDIVKAQASVRIMSEDEIISMVRRLSSDIKNVAEGEQAIISNRPEIGLRKKT